ncbi:hypothetical protein [Shewanella vaxholmensis]|uniref:hypothetical protein n=1 Tax=Shewanella vaxholmensis TaxID=3063535 RepID=UPI00318EAEF8
MKFKSGLSVLSKSLPYAVRALNQHVNEIEDTVRKDLFIQTDIRKVFKERLITASSTTILSLCGSCGDGELGVLIENRSAESFESKRAIHTLSLQSITMANKSIS